MPKNYTYNELIHHAYKIGRANNAILTRVEIEEPRMKMFRVAYKNQEEEDEYTDEGKKLTKVRDFNKVQEFERYGGKLCLCDYMQEYRDRIPYYNRQYKETTGVPLYDNSGELIRWGGRTKSLYE